jgi:hypothetical protein
MLQRIVGRNGGGKNEREETKEEGRRERFAERQVILSLSISSFFQ